MTTIETDQLTEEQLMALIRRYRQLMTDAAELTGEAKAIKQQIADGVPVGWSFTVDGLTCSKREGNREFNIALAVSLLTPEQRAACKVVRFDDKMVREILKKDGKLDEAMQPKPESEPVVKI